jgi:hypothetical protein
VHVSGETFRPAFGKFETVPVMDPVAAKEFNRSKREATQRHKKAQRRRKSGTATRTEGRGHELDEISHVDSEGGRVVELPTDDEDRRERNLAHLLQEAAQFLATPQVRQDALMASLMSSYRGPSLSAEVKVCSTLGKESTRAGPS